ncbi:hypothetical protein WG66_007266 [Moniliophthora roreri]|nr:hypothetical protein WG66_007266 [Moniliophthora roreri]
MPVSDFTWRPHSCHGESSNYFATLLPTSLGKNAHGVWRTAVIWLLYGRQMTRGPELQRARPNRTVPILCGTLCDMPVSYHVQCTAKRMSEPAEKRLLMRARECCRATCRQSFPGSPSVLYVFSFCPNGVLPIFAEFKRSA